MPSLLSKTNEDNKADVANTVLQIAQGMFPDLAPAKALEEYEKVVQKNPMELAELTTALTEIFEMEIEDTQHARVNQTEDDKLTYVLVVLSYVGVAACIAALVYVTTLNLQAGTLATIAATIGAAATWMQQQVQQITNFKYGSSIGSKLKELNKK